MTRLLKYLLLTITFAFLSSGVLVAGFLDVYDEVGYRIFWLLLPMTLLFISAVAVNDKYLIPRLLLRGRYRYYCIGVLGVVYLLSLVALCLEYGTRFWLDMPMRISDYTCPWILADILGNSLLLAMMLLGLGLLHLYRCWDKEAKEEKALACQLESYILTVSKRLNLSAILVKLQGISENVLTAPGATVTRIRDLSNYLREQLYELPEPPSIESTVSTAASHSHIADWLVARRYRPFRHIIFIAILAVISCGAFFNAPDNPEFSFDRFLGVMSMFGILLLIAYVNILWLCPKFLKRGSVKRYAISVGALLLAIAAPLILLQILTYEPNVYSKPLPAIIAVISTIGSILTLFFFVGGISSVLMLQNWAQTNRRVVLLKAETVRQEYAWLRKQINPHFLFNVLNNIGICAYDDPELTLRQLADLQHLLKYQLLDIRRETTTVKNECAFINSYFALESTRRDRFEYALECEASDDVEIPTLLFLPFVENAVKYCTIDDGGPDVQVSFSMKQDILRFTCKNRYKPDRVKLMKSGGIGVVNTLQRLKYIYGDTFGYNVANDGKTYTVDLKIPLT